MRQVLNSWSQLDIGRRAVIVLAAIAIIATLATLVRMATSPSLSLLYSGLESGPAGEVVNALEQRNAMFEVRGGSIFVESHIRDELRMTLASEGMPANSNRGYELLDSLSGFGTTSQMFTAAYWRAKEGELARTIAGSPHITSARVHIANTSSSPFQRGTKASASISIATASGVLSPAHATALKHLVSSAVAGMEPGDVAVIDGSGMLITGPDQPSLPAGADDRADGLRQKIVRLLEARVGRGNAVVEVSVDTVTETERIREHMFDPDSRVAISTESEERSTNSKDSGGGDVTVASNLPDGDAAQGDTSSRQNSETRERVNYEISETHREVTREPGAIKRITVAVLVNGQLDPDNENARLPRAEDELTDLRELVTSAVGFDQARGDVITIKSMTFDPMPALASPPAADFWSSLHVDAMAVLQMMVLAIVALVLGLFVIRPVLVRPPRALQPEMLAASDIQPETPDMALADSGGGLAPLTGMIDNGDGEFPDVSISDGFAGPDDVSLPDLIMPGPPEAPVERLRALIGERQDETVEILKDWLESTEENA